MTRLCGWSPPLELEVADLGQAYPGGDVGFMVNGRANDFGIAREGEGEGLG